MPQSDLENHPSHSRHSRSCEGRGSLSVTNLMQDNMSPLPADALPLSPVCPDSWSGSSNTGDRPSPQTPEFGPPVVATIVRSNESPITSFLSQFYNAEPGPATEERTMPTQDHVIAEIPYVPLQVVPEDVEPPPSNVDDEIEHHPPLPDVRKARRFGLCLCFRRVVGGIFELDISFSSTTLSTSSSTRPLAFEFPCPPPISRNIGPLSERETKKVQEFLREWGERESRRVRSEDSSSQCDNLPRVPSGDRASDEFSWEARDSDSDSGDVNGLGDATRCSVLIHEVSLMVGIPSDEEQPLGDNGHPSAPDVPEHLERENQDVAVLGAPDVSLRRQPPLPPEITHANQTPSSRKFVNTRLPPPGMAGIGVFPTDVLGPPDRGPQADKGRAALYGGFPVLAQKCGRVDDVAIIIPQLPPVPPLSPQKSPSVLRPRGMVTAVPRKSAEVIRPGLSARRQGQVFQFGEPIVHRPCSGTVVMDEEFFHPREPPKPTISPAQRISALDRLESSLVRLKAHAPGHHHKSESEVAVSGRSSRDLAQGGREAAVSSDCPSYPEA
ncbi:hypothetical protein BU15DRAFT_73365 [Melanogaster broomeanus]|nr:hypothetical protein BU15DRAFT_73365 [Melanogaster broomeanus]